MLCARKWIPVWIWFVRKVSVFKLGHSEHRLLLFFYPPKVFTNIFCTNKILLTNISFEIMAINRKYAYWKIMLGHLYRNFEDRFQSQKRIDCEAARRFYQPFSAFLSVFQILKYFRKGTYSHKHTHTNTLNSFAVTSNDSLWLAYMFCAENS